jgi:hypothetical protein
MDISSTGTPSIWYSDGILVAIVGLNLLAACVYPSNIRQRPVNGGAFTIEPGSTEVPRTKLPP